MNKILVAALALLITGCASISSRPSIEKSEPITANTVEICEQEEFKIFDRPTPITTLPVEFMVITNKDDTVNFFATNEAGVLMSIKSYENLGLNMQEIIRYLHQSNDLLDQYESKNDIISR